MNINSLMAGLDVAATQALNGLARGDAFFDTPMAWVSAVGVPLMVLATIGQWWGRHDRSYTRHVPVAAGISFLLGLAINQLILMFVHRMRPYDAGLTHLLIAPSADKSIPSDHATAAFAIAVAILLHGMSRRGTGFLAVAFLIAVSWVYVGTHYVSDVLAGVVTGIAAASLVRVLYWHDTRLDRFVTRIL